MTTGALLDTSVLIAGAKQHEMPVSVAISVISIGELVAGVGLARDAAARRLRQDRLDALRAAFLPLPVDIAVAVTFGELLALARNMGRSEKASDLLIVATASATGRTLHTLDERQASFARATGLEVA